VIHPYIYYRTLDFTTVAARLTLYHHHHVKPYLIVSKQILTKHFHHDFSRSGQMNPRAIPGYYVAPARQFVQLEALVPCAGRVSCPSTSSLSRTSPPNRFCRIGFSRRGRSNRDLAVGHAPWSLCSHIGKPATDP
jgi:hypothetical protein